MSELTSYESEIEGYLSEIAKENTSGTEKFLMLSNEVPILDAKYGEQTFVVLSLINLGKTDITDVVVTPTVSNDRTKWPFDIQQAYDAQTIQIIQASNCWRQMTRQMHLINAWTLAGTLMSDRMCSQDAIL